MALTKTKFKGYFKGFLKAFNNEKIEITDDTIISEMVQSNQEVGILKAATIITLKNGETEVKKFPKNWTGLTVKVFVESMLFLLLCIGANAQLQIKLGTVKTADKNTAVSLGLQYAIQLDSIWNSKEVFYASKRSIFTMAPQFDIQTGSQDAFSWINFKMTGMFTKFKTTKIDDIDIPDLSKPVQTFPISVGAESNNTFSTINGIVEAGWVPWYHSATGNVPELLKSTQIGFFVQGGYKFKADSTGNQALGGNKDQSLEKVNSNLLRAKGSFSIDTKGLVKAQGINVGLVGKADVWYDFVNAKFYHKVQGIMRTELLAGQYLDIIYEKGSGAPNFNTNDQYGIGLTITF